MHRTLLLAATFTALAGLTPASAQLSNPVVSNVNCSTGGSLQTTIDTSVLERPIEIAVVGTCTQNVTIKRDHVLIRSTTPGSRVSTIQGTIEIIGANDVELRDLIVEEPAGPRIDGIVARQGASIKLDNLLVRRFRRYPLAIVRNSVAVVDRSVLIGHAVSEDTIVVTDGSVLKFDRSKATASRVTSGFGAALGLYRNSTARLQNNARPEHTSPSASDPWEGGAVFALDNSVVRLQQGGLANSINGNVVIGDSAAGDFRNVTITGLMRVDRMGLIELRNSTTVNGNIVSGTRALLDYKGAAHTGTLDCFNDGAAKGVPGGITPGAGCTVY